MKFCILVIFLSANCFADIQANENPEYKYIYINYRNQKVEQYFLVVGLERNKIKFEEVDSKAILGFQNYLKFKNAEAGTILLKTEEMCLIDLSKNEGLHSFENEYAICKRSSSFENLGNNTFIFWLKKIYFTYRDIVDWL